MIEKNDLAQYSDTYSPEFRVIRSREAIKHIYRLNEALLKNENRTFLPPFAAFLKLIEVGSGNGGVTLALQALYPYGEIIAIDREECEGKALKSAKELGVPFQNKDVLGLSYTEGAEVFSEGEIVYALRTSVLVAAHLIKNLQTWGFSGDLVFSYILESERPSPELLFIHSKARSRDILIQPLIEQRGLNEIGYVCRI